MRSLSEFFITLVLILLMVVIAYLTIPWFQQWVNNYRTEYQERKECEVLIKYGVFSSPPCTITN